MGQVSITFTGVTQATQVQFLDVQGLFPAVGTLWIIPQATLPYQIGTLEISDGENFIRIRECKIDQASIHVNVNTGMVEKFDFFDERWKSAFGALDGDYNEKLWDGSVADGRDKTARQLVALGLDAMNASAGYNVDAFPDDDYPRAEWDCSNARGELGRLISLYGVDFVVDRNALVFRAVTIGVGADLPPGSTSSVSYDVDIAELPDSVQVCPHPTVYQQKFKLELRMLDTDGEWKSPADVSYKPADGWEAQDDPGDLIPDQEGTEAHQYANAFGYRAYAITAVADGTLDIVEYGTVGQIEQLELRERLAESFTVTTGANGVAYDLDPVVQGARTVRSKPDVVADDDINTTECDVLDINFRMDAEQQMVFFSEHMFRIIDNAGTAELKPADLYLTTSFLVKDPDTHAPVRVTQSTTLATNGTAPYVDPRPDIVRRVIGHYDNASDCKEVTSVTDNDADIQPLFDTALAAAAAKFPTKKSKMLKYNGIVPIQLDGKRTQVMYVANLHTGADTIAWVGTEMAPGGLRRHERERLYRQAQEGSRRRLPPRPTNRQ